ncbi:hypothetical protein KU75_06470 [Pectobacterium odoriferum]|uniref:Uncharacterized protein n=1 Tax=Pectobacterium odoriferum TaxID=78398 RepID=A0ABR4VSI3_9GAMM|nr:hypothetical protein [Pectobacterium odoriferum]KGA42349.1 hypothetical protein KU75_06470 [Pectobacterium odoriferum]
MFSIVLTWTDRATGRTTEDGIWHRRYTSRKAAEKAAARLGYVIPGAHGGECVARVVEGMS